MKLSNSVGEVSVPKGNEATYINNLMNISPLKKRTQIFLLFGWRILPMEICDQKYR